MKPTKNKTRSVPPASPTMRGKQERVILKNGKALSHWIALALICLLGIIIYSNTFDCSFNFDDNPNILQNENIKEGATFRSLWAYNHNRFWPYLSLALNYRLDGLEVWGYHFFNLLVHLINACLVYWIGLLIFSTPVLKDTDTAKKKHGVALMIALLFVSHPLATQSVTYIIQRIASMAALFYFLSLALYLKGRLTAGTSKYFFFAGALLSAFMAFTSKENAYTLPAVLLLTEFCLLQAKRIRLAANDYRIYAAPAVIVLLAAYALSAFTLDIFKPIPPSFGNAYTITWQNYFFTQFSVIVKYIQLLILPVSQQLDYDFPIAESFFEWQTLASAALLLAILVFAIYRFRKDRLVSFCIFWFFITLSVESGLVPIADVIFEHRTYIPSLGFFILISHLVFSMGEKMRKVSPLLVLSLIVFSFATLAYSRNRLWKDELTLLQDDEKKSPRKPRLKVNIGMQYFNSGDDDNALKYFKAALAMNDKYIDALNNIAVIHLKRAQWREAVDLYGRIISLDSSYSKVYYGRGAAYCDLQRWDSAIGDFSRAIRLKPDYAKAYAQRGYAYSNLDRQEEAVADYSKALELDAEVKNTLENRGLSYVRLGKFDLAAADFSKLLEQEPNYSKGYMNRANCFVNLGQFDRAAADFGRVLELEPGNEFARKNRELAIRDMERQTGKQQ